MVQKGTGSFWGFILMMIGGFMACGNQPESLSTPENSGNILRIGLSDAPRTLDPRLSTDVASARIQQLIFNSLVKKNINSEIIPDLAERWEIIDNKTYRFFLRKNIRFHDGSKLTARDVKATFDSVLSEQLASPKKNAYDKLSSISIEDDYTIVFQTSEPFAPFLVNMILGILPKSEAEKLDPNIPIQPIGTGPFSLESQSGDDTIVIRAFAEHFTGRPKLDQVIFRVIPDDTIRLMELEKGDIDFLQNSVPFDALEQLRQNEKLKVVSAPGTTFFYMGFNFRLDYPCSNPLVRRAIAMGINRDEIIQSLLNNTAVPSVSVLPEGHWAFNTSLTQIPFNPAQAERLLDDAGYPRKNGMRFTLEFKCSQNKQSQQLAEVIQAQFQAIGIEVTIRSLEWGTFYDDVVKGNFQTYILSWVGVTDPDIFFSLFHSESIPPNGRNRGHYRNPEMDKLLEQGRCILDTQQRTEIYHRIQGIAAEDLPYVNLWHSNNIAVMKEALVGYQMYPAGDFDSIARLQWRNH